MKRKSERELENGAMSLELRFWFRAKPQRIAFALRRFICQHHNFMFKWFLAHLFNTSNYECNRV